jgi:alpha-methylacyl-CoA racemase
MGVLKGIRVLECEAIGPAPFGTMLLADMGADVLRIDRPVAADDLGPKVSEGLRADITGRGKRSVTLDLKNSQAAEAALELIERADVLIEGFRPRTMERLGLGPAIALARNPRLVYARMTGWGQTGPLAERAGHDLNYIALSGVLSGIGPKDGAPLPPLNLVGDYGGGGMLLVVGVLAALLNVQRGGAGQVVDAAMSEGAAQLGSVIWGLLASGNWREERGSNFLDGGSPWYATYRTRDDQYMAVGAVEARFYARLLDGLGLADAGLPGQHDQRSWPRLRRPFRRHSSSEPVTNGAPSSIALTPALRRCWRSRKRPIIRTIAHAAALSKQTASCSRHRRHAFSAHRPNRRYQRRDGENSESKRWAIGA